ncbi:MAG: thiol-disulfide oxidoreductase DCC family protein [Pyrinomonadaceae bacterium]
MNRAARIEVYTDGRCPLCIWSRSLVEPRDRDGRIQWLDFNDPEAQRRAAPHTPAELSQEMHVRRADGVWTKGFHGWLDVLGVLPRWRRLARVLSVWPFIRLGPVFYRAVARRRYQLFGIPPPCDAESVCSLHESKSARR